jgi:hypothetical protein
MLKLAPIVECVNSLGPFSRGKSNFKYDVILHGMLSNGQVVRFILSITGQPLVGQGLLNVQASRSQSRQTTIGRTSLDG